MAFGGTAVSAITAMWILTALTFVFVLLRMYTRIWVVQSHGIDDHVYNLAFAFLLIYVIFITISGVHGLGYSMDEIADSEDAVHAVLYEAVGQTFAVVGMAIAKSSLGLFLLRLVTKTWHKTVIWMTMIVLIAASISVVFVFWLQCTPPAYLFDKRIREGYCLSNSTPAILCVLVDFFFALFPWLFIWGLQMNKREKMVILVSMSLGIIAGACGIKRTMEVPELSSLNYLKDTVGLIVWSAAEIAVTMICIGIPVCRPLYKTFLEKITLELSSPGFSDVKNKKNHKNKSFHQRNSQMHALETFPGEETDANDEQFSHATDVLDVEKGKSTPDEIDTYILEAETGNKAFAISAGRRASDEGSDEEILGLSTGWTNNIRHEFSNGIMVTEEYHVTSSVRRHN